MKTFIFLAFFLSIGLVAFPQINRYDIPASSTYKNTYVSSDFDLLIKALSDRQALYDQNKNAIDALINWTYDLKSQTNEKQFIDAMDSYYKKLRAFDGQDFSVLSNQIRAIELGIKEEIEKYNTRLKEANDPAKYWDAGMENLNNKDFRNAIQNFSYVIQLSPDYAPAYYYRGVALFEMGNATAAIPDLSKAIDMSPNEPIGYYYRGWAKYKQNDYMGAISDFNKEIELSPNIAVGYYNRGCAKSELNDYYGAISDYKKAIEFDPTFSMAYNNLGWAKFNQNKFNEALVDVNKAIELDNTNSVAFDSRAEIKFNLNDFKGCIEDADSAIMLDPNLNNSYFLKGRAYYRLGNKEEACINWSKAGELGKAEAYEYISKYCSAK